MGKLRLSVKERAKADELSKVAKSSISLMKASEPDQTQRFFFGGGGEPVAALCWSRSAF